MKVLLFNSREGNTNTYKLVTEFIKQASAKNIEVETLQTSKIEKCIGCRGCLNKESCIHIDLLADYLKNKSLDAFIFAGPVYFFSLNSELQKVLERLMSYDLRNKVLGLILTSGSNFRYGGADLIIEQFKRIDEYCGSVTIETFNKVTYDKITPLNECDILGIKKFIEDLKTEILISRGGCIDKV